MYYSKILAQVYRTFLLHLVQSSLTFYLTAQLLTPSAATELSQVFNNQIKEVAKFAMPLVESLGVEDGMVRAPIAKDWAEYNKGDNQGELLKSML